MPWILVSLAGCGAASIVAGAGGPLSTGETSVTVAVQTDGGAPWTLVDLAVATGPEGLRWTDAKAVRVEAAPPPMDVVLVVDNSGSVEGDVAPLRDAVEGFAGALYDEEAGHRVGLVRVSTEARLLAAPTDDASALGEAAGEMFLSNGWTALWDGIRGANEALDEAGGGEDGRVPVVVVFAAGGDNNSADQTGLSSGDGVDTTRASLVDLHAGGVRTSVHAIELGDPPLGVAPLAQLAAATGGTHARVDDLDALSPALLDTAELLASQVRVAFVPADCAHTHARVEATLRVGDVEEVAVATAPIPASCE